MKKEFTRREVIGVGLGAAALVTAGTAISPSYAKAADTAGSSEPEVLNKFGEELENGLLLRTSPLAVKMLEK